MAASGIISEAILAARELFAATATFQSVTGTASEIACLPLVRGIGPRESTITRPAIIVSSPRVHHVGRGGFCGGTMLCIFEDAVPEAYRRGTLPDGEVDNELGSEAFLNWVGDVLKEAMDVSELGGRLMAIGFDGDGKLTRSAPTEKVDYFQIMYTLKWGTQ